MFLAASFLGLFKYVVITDDLNWFCNLDDAICLFCLIVDSKNDYPLWDELSEFCNPSDVC